MQVNAINVENLFSCCSWTSGLGTAGSGTKSLPHYFIAHCVHSKLAWSAHRCTHCPHLAELQKQFYWMHSTSKCSHIALHQMPSTTASAASKYYSINRHIRNNPSFQNAFTSAYMTLPGSHQVAQIQGQNKGIKKLGKTLRIRNHNFRKVITNISSPGWARWVQFSMTMVLSKAGMAAHHANFVRISY